jgi:hypothetical protein
VIAFVSYFTNGYTIDIYHDIGLLVQKAAALRTEMAAISTERVREGLASLHIP